MWFHVLANLGMKNAEITIFICLDLLLNVILHIVTACVYLQFIAIAKGKTMHATENVKLVSEYGSQAAAAVDCLGPTSFFLFC